VIAIDAWPNEEAFMQAAENVLGSETKLAIEDAVRGHEGRPGSLLGILERVQQADPHRFLSIAALRCIADKTGLPAAQVFSAATFFALFNLTPQGDNVISVCRGTACHTRSSRDLLERLCFELGLGGDDVHALSDADKLSLTTQDRKFTIRTVACFGQCALAPVVEINHQILSHVNERTLQREVKALTQGRP
jgi:NADH-quinone oxidoreductase subunit E